MKKRILGKEPPCFPVRELLLKNRQSGEERAFFLREYRRGDEEGILSCIRSEYGESYFKRDFYRMEELRKKAEGNRYLFFVAQTGERIAGMLILAFFEPAETCAELASGILRPEFRGYDLGKHLIDYVTENARLLGPSCLMAHVVTFHRAAQKLCVKNHMTPVGFRLGTFLTERMQNSYVKGPGKCRKYSEGIVVQAVAKQDAGTLYLPEEIAAFAGKVYSRLGVAFRIETRGPGSETINLPEKCRLSVTEDELQRTCWMALEEPGKDLTDIVNQKLRSRREELWCYQISLKANDPCLPALYGQLKELGFFFTGCKPLCGRQERIYMQWTGKLELHMERYELTEAFEELRRDIEYFYRERKSG